MSIEPPRTRSLHSKRHPKTNDSPAYDASEEDNEALTDDANSAISVSIAAPRHSNTTTSSRTAHPKPSPASRGKFLARNLVSDSDTGVDSPTYDGDVESSTTAGADTPASHRISYHHHHSTSSVSTLNTPITASTPNFTSGNEPSNPVSPVVRATNPDSNHPVFISPPMNTHLSPQIVTNEPAVAAGSTAATNPATFTPEDIQSFIAKAIAGETGRDYKINPPPVGRPVRVYADGLYDLFHFGHSLQLRQAKLSFPSVYLLAGVNSDELVATYNQGRCVMTHDERQEAVRHCRWVDQVIGEAPWIITEDFLKKYEIDYVAHDEAPYPSAGHADVYSYVKSQGKFIPTRRTQTSGLLARIVSGYQKQIFDEQTGHSESRTDASQSRP